MPRKASPPRLSVRDGYWVIRDGQTYRRTGCREDEVEAAQRRLGEYIASKWRPDTSSSDPNEVTIESVVSTYFEHAAPKRPNKHRRNELWAQCDRLLAFGGSKPIRAVNGAWCRSYARAASTQSMARHDLEILRAAVNHYDKEFGLEYKPAFTLPAKGKPRHGHLTRSMAASLVHAAHRAGNAHLVRYLLLGLYTGTRSGALLDLQWEPNTNGGWVDLDKGVIYRAPEGHQQTKKRRTPAVIPDKLLPWLRRWKAQDEGLRHVIHFRGRPVQSIKKSFIKAREAAGLPEWVIPHILRHSAITWAMQRGVRIASVADFFGVTVQELERTYWHHHPEYQQEMRKAK